MKPPKPLTGIRIAVTRAKEDQLALSTRLKSLGAEIILLPAIRKVTLLPERSRLTLLEQIKGYDWVVFTSPFAVQVLETQDFPLAQACKNTAVAAVGPSTAQILEHHGISPACIPSPHTWHHFPNCMGDLKGTSICLPRSRRGAVSFPEMLRNLGARVVEVWTYNTIPFIAERSHWTALESGIDYVLFSSGSTVHGFNKGLEEHGLSNCLDETKLVCIGPSAAEVCRNILGRTDLVAQPHTEEGLISALINHIKLEHHHE
jgi:uroporphyrinogen-III synthase